MKIIESKENPRGCGYRKEGGLYLVSGGASVPCLKLPIELTICPCCGNGIKPSRGWTWIDNSLIINSPCKDQSCKGCVPFDGSIEKFGLLWIGTAFYKTRSDFTREAAERGVSRRIRFIPKDFKVGETWVLLAHRNAVLNQDGSYTPAIFYAFMPTAIEYIVKGTESTEELERLEKRGVTLIKLVKLEYKQTKLEE